jgi:7-cyano-7-deazaguanine synthase in queuosine biosynthesis
MTPFTISFGRAEDSNLFSLTAGQDFRFGLDAFERFFQDRLPSRIVDLLRIAASVYVVDRLVRRRQRNQQRHWSRSIKIRIGVIEPGFWLEESMREALTDTLEFLSDDTWQFEFFKDDRRERRELQRTLFQVPTNSLVALYSGGLDSAAGLANRIASLPDRPVLPVIVWHQPIQRKIVQSQFDSLTNRSGAPITPLIVKAAIIWRSELKNQFRPESSQRSRAFLFCSAGAAAAAMIKGSTVELLESGIGSINLPLMSGMVGSRTTRSTHPQFLKRMGQLLSTILEREFSFTLPLWSKTKGQVVDSAIKLGHEELIQQTVSCVHYPLREAEHKQCGICPACIFRRQALAVAGITEASGKYKYDLFTDPVAANRLGRSHLKYLMAFLSQVVQLTNVRANQPIPPRFGRHLFGTGILRTDESPTAVQHLLETYRDEWVSVMNVSRRQGFGWAHLVGQDVPHTEGATHAVA